MSIHKIQIIAQTMNDIINIWYIKVGDKSGLNDADIFSQQMNEQSFIMLVIKEISEWSLPLSSWFIGIG